MEWRTAALLSDLNAAPEHERDAAAVQLRAWLDQRTFRQDGRTTPLRLCAALLLAAGLVVVCVPSARWPTRSPGRDPRPESPLAPSLYSSRAAAESPARRLEMLAPPWTGHYPDHSAFERPIDVLRRLRPDRKTSNFPLLLCVGHGKSATKSLNRALLMLGYSSAHFYGAGIFSLLFNNAAELHDHDFLFEPATPSDRHVDAVLDTPVVDFYNEILLTYPNAKVITTVRGHTDSLLCRTLMPYPSIGQVILTVRALKSWLRSQQNFYTNYARGCAQWPAPWRRGANLVFGTECAAAPMA